MLTADAADENRPESAAAPTKQATPAERAQAAVLVAAQEFTGPFVCRACALQFVHDLVQAAVEAAESEVRRAIKEQTRCLN